MVRRRDGVVGLAAGGALNYLGLKFAHVFIAIAALGSSAAVVIMLGCYANHPTNGGFVLGMARRLLWAVVVPGYVLMLATGMWMGHEADLLDAHWAELAMNVWGAGALFLALTLRAVHRGSVAQARGFSLGWALVLVTMLYLMVFKPI